MFIIDPVPASAWPLSGSVGHYGPPKRTAVEESLLRCFEAATSDPSEDSDAALRLATEAFVKEIKDRGTPPERAVVALKAVLRGHGQLTLEPSLSAEPLDPPSETLPSVYARVFHWCVEAYFDEQDA
jgi:hypothetical protein